MIKLKFIFIFFFSIVLSLCSLAQFTVDADTQSILIGQPIQLDLYLENDTSDIVEWPKYNVGDLLGDKAEIIDLQPIDTITKSSSRLFKQRILITSFDSGVWAIPPISTVMNGDSLFSEAFVFSVNTVEVDTSVSIKPIKEPYEFPYTFEELVQKYWWIGAIALWLALVVYLIVRQLKKKPTPVKTQVVEPEVHPVDWVIAELNELEKESLWQEGKYKEFHVRWSEVFREFLERQFKIPAPESTTDEIEVLLKRTALSEVHKKELISAFRISDLVKFARTTPLANENEYCLQTARSIAEHLKKQEVEKNQNSQEQ